MKKNKMMRLASALLVAVLLTTSVISGTYAKYVTDKTGTDTARVAKWDVQIGENGKLFAKNYVSDDEDYKLLELTNNSVESVNNWNVLAPGTTGDMTEVALEGTTEVAVRVSYSGNLVITDKDQWVVAGKEYFPIIFTVEGKTYGINGMSTTALDHAYNTIDELEAAVENAILAYTKDYAPNTDFATEIPAGDPLSVSWKWEYHVSDDNDKKDTILGEHAVAKDISISLDVITTVTQID